MYFHCRIPVGGVSSVRIRAVESESANNQHQSCWYVVIFILCVIILVLLLTCGYLLSKSMHTEHVLLSTTTTSSVPVTPISRSTKNMMNENPNDFPNRLEKSKTPSKNWCR